MTIPAFPQANYMQCTTGTSCSQATPPRSMPYSIQRRQQSHLDLSGLAGSANTISKPSVHTASPVHSVTSHPNPKVFISV